jgi:hypothetical protein
MREKKNAKNREKEERKNIECKTKISRIFAFKNKGGIVTKKIFTD